MTTHTNTLKASKKAVSRILQGKSGCFYLARTASKHDPDWLFIAAAASEAAAQTALAGMVKDADDLGKHRTACGAVVADGRKIRFEMGAIKSFKPRLSAGQTNSALKALKKHPGMSFLGKVSIAAAAGAVESEDGTASTDDEVITGGELTEAEMMGVFIDDGVPMLAAQELVQASTGLAWDLRMMSTFDLDIFQMNAIVEPLLVEIQEGLAHEMYAELEAGLEADHRESYLMQCRITDAFLRTRADGVFVYTDRCRYKDQPLLAAGTDESGMRKMNGAFSADGATTRSCRFTFHAEDDRYILLSEDLVSPIQKELSRLSVPRTVVNAAGLDTTDPDALTAAIEARKDERIRETVTSMKVKDICRAGGPLRDMFASHAAEECAEESVAFLDSAAAFKAALERGEAADHTDILNTVMLPEGADGALNISYAVRAQFVAYRDAIAAGTTTHTTEAFLTLLQKAEKSIVTNLKDTLSRFKEKVEAHKKVYAEKATADAFLADLEAARGTAQEARKKFLYTNKRDELKEWHDKLAEYQKIASALCLSTPAIPTWESLGHALPVE